MKAPVILVRFVKFNFAFLSGWGRTVGGGYPADTLQQADLSVAEHSACDRVNGRLIRVDERSMLCAGGQGKGGCQVTSFISQVLRFTHSE